MLRPLRESNGVQELSLRRDSLITVALRVQIKRRLNLIETQEGLHGFRIGLRFICQPIELEVP
jgi:hypothetical protein